MLLHAFVDESKTRNYVLVAAVLHQADVAAARRVVKGLLLGSQRRIHFYKESRARKQEILSVVAKICGTAYIYVSPLGPVTHRRLVSRGWSTTWPP